MVNPNLRHDLLEAGVLTATAVDGIYLRSARYESVVRGIEAAYRREIGDEAEELLHLPPLMSREWFMNTDYLRSFPDLMGSIHTFSGNDIDHARLLQLADDGKDWTELLEPSELMLASAACHTIYPMIDPVLPEGGRRMEVSGTCFRHEPSIDPARMQSFRMHEYVRIGTPEQAQTHRDEWLARMVALMESFGLTVTTDVANDPFFGRVGRMLTANQLGAELKFEVLCAITSEDKLTAIASGNNHEDHFGQLFDIRTTDGELAHSACAAIGLERVVLAIFATHGVDMDAWPAEARAALSL